jgi:hypothetical protein
MTTNQPANIHHTNGTVITATHVAIIGDGKIHVTTTDTDNVPTITSYDAADIHRIDFLTS